MDRAALPRHIFHCRIIPERDNWYVVPSFVVSLPSGPATVDMRMTLTDSQLSVDVTGEFHGTLLDLKNVVLDAASVLTDALGHVMAAALRVEVVSCVDPDGVFHVFNTRFWGLGDSHGEEMLAVLLHQGWTNINVRSALADLRDAILQPLNTAFLCYRAIESIRQDYVTGKDDDASRKQSWHLLRAATSRSEEELLWLRDQARLTRHGGRVASTEDDRRKALRIARDVVETHCWRSTPLQQSSGTQDTAGHERPGGAT